MDLQKLLNKWKIKCDINVLLAMWNESHRFYHTLDHLNNLIDQIDNDKSKLSEIEYEKLIICALFHDCIYEPIKSDNEEKSAEFFINCCVDKSNPDIQDIKQMILDTKTHQSNTKLSEIFNRYDMSVVEGDFDELLKWENGIRAEFVPHYGADKYKIGRISFLKSLLDKYPNNTENLLKLIDFVENQ